nr:FAD-binding protein [Clostridia bacterium]
RREARLCEAFQGRIRLEEGEFVHQVRVNAEYARMPYAHIKQTIGEKIGYPAVTVSALFDSERLRVAFSGICSEPFRSGAMEEALNDQSAAPRARVRRAVEALPLEPLSDPEGSGEYRLCVLQKLLTELLERQDHENL